jgi:hypothetical protein
MVQSRCMNKCYAQLPYRFLDSRSLITILLTNFTSLRKELSIAMEQQLEQQSEIAKLSQVFLRVIIIKNRRYRGYTYRNVFVGSETVDALVEAGFATSREEAVSLSRRLEKDLRLFSHVAGHHLFKDEYLFYRLTDNESLDLSWANCQNGLSIDQNTLINKAHIFRQLANIKDRKYLFKTYKNCFVGSEIVDTMVYAGLVQSRQDAVILGRAIQNRLNWFRHVTGHHNFKDDRLFYRFIVSADLSSPFGFGSICPTTSSNNGKKEHLGKIINRLNKQYPASTVSGMQKVMEELQERLKRVYTGHHQIFESGFISPLAQRRQSSSLWTTGLAHDGLVMMNNITDDNASSASYTEFTVLEDELSDDESVYTTEETIQEEDDGIPIRESHFPCLDDVSALTHLSF